MVANMRENYFKILTESYCLRVATDHVRQSCILQTLHIICTFPQSSCHVHLASQRDANICRWPCLYDTRSQRYGHRSCSHADFYFLLIKFLLLFTPCSFMRMYSIFWSHSQENLAAYSFNHAPDPTNFKSSQETMLFRDKSWSPVPVLKLL